jgi:hypothetical protein
VLNYRYFRWLFARPLLEYRQAFRAYWKLKDGELPRFDLVLLAWKLSDALQALPEHHEAARIPVTCGSH